MTAAVDPVVEAVQQRLRALEMFNGEWLDESYLQRRLEMVANWHQRHQQVTAERDALLSFLAERGATYAPYRPEAKAPENAQTVAV